MLPGDLLLDDATAYVNVVEGKTDRVALRQHTVIDEKMIVAYVSALYSSLNPKDRLYPGSAAQFRRRWNYLFSFLDIPHHQCD